MGCLFARGRGQWSKLESDTNKQKKKPKTGAFRGGWNQRQNKKKTHTQSKFSKSFTGNSKFPLSFFQSWYLNASWSGCSCVWVQIASRVVLPRDGWRIKMLIKRFHSWLIQWHPRLLLVTAGMFSFKHYMSQNSLGENTNWEKLKQKRLLMCLFTVQPIKLRSEDLRENDCNGKWQHTEQSAHFTSVKIENYYEQNVL